MCAVGACETKKTNMHGMHWVKVLLAGKPYAISCGSKMGWLFGRFHDVVKKQPKKAAQKNGNHLISEVLEPGSLTKLVQGILKADCRVLSLGWEGPELEQWLTDFFGLKNDR